MTTEATAHERGPYRKRWCDPGWAVVDSRNGEVITGRTSDSARTGEMADVMNSAHAAAEAKYAGLVAAAERMMERLDDGEIIDCADAEYVNMSRELAGLRTAHGGGETGKGK